VNKLYFKDGDKWEVDHIISKSQGGTNNKDNLQLLHLHCHDKKTAKDSSLRTSNRSQVEKPILRTERKPWKQVETVPCGNYNKRSSTYDKGGTIEEPPEVKVSSPVLKTPRGEYSPLHGLV